MYERSSTRISAALPTRIARRSLTEKREEGNRLSVGTEARG
jgi:hypothetical protein